MSITSRDEVIAALATNSSRVIIDKASVPNQTAGRFCAMWRSTGQPAQGAIPTTAALVTNATTGTINFTQQTAPATSYLGLLDVVASNSAQTLEIHDRLAHMGGLVLNTTSSQTTNLPISLVTLAPNPDGGATASTATINVTFNDGSSADLSTVSVGGTLRAGNRLSLNSLRTVSQQTLYIRAVNSIVLSASTGTAGNFGFTATRIRAYLPLAVPNMSNKLDWATAGLPEIPNESGLELMVLPSTTSSGTLRGGGKILHG